MNYERKMTSVIPTAKDIYGSVSGNGVKDGTAGVEVNCNVFEIWGAVEFPDDTTSFRFINGRGEMEGINLSWMNNDTDIVLPYIETRQLNYIKIPVGSNMRIQVGRD